MSPVPHRGERNESRFMIHVAERLAQVFDCTVEDIISATNRNAKALFGLK
jgi:TatD DNase family protein